MTDKSKTVLIKNMSDNIKMLRVRLGMSQNELAEAVGISRHAVMNIETNRSEMTWDVFLALAGLFGRNYDTKKLLKVLEIYTDELEECMQLGDCI